MIHEAGFETERDSEQVRGNQSRVGGSQDQILSFRLKKSFLYGKKLSDMGKIFLIYGHKKNPREADFFLEMGGIEPPSESVSHAHLHV